MLDVKRAVGVARAGQLGRLEGPPKEAPLLRVEHRAREPMVERGRIGVVRVGAIELAGQRLGHGHRLDSAECEPVGLERLLALPSHGRGHHQARAHRLFPHVRRRAAATAAAAAAATRVATGVRIAFAVLVTAPVGVAAGPAAVAAQAPLIAPAAVALVLPAALPAAVVAVTIVVIVTAAAVAIAVPAAAAIIGPALRRTGRVEARPRRR